MVVLVKSHHRVGAHDGLPTVVGHQVIGDIEQGRDEELVGSYAHLVVLILLSIAVGQVLGNKAALGPGGDNDGILGDLSLHQAEHLGAEVLGAVAPAQTTAGNLAKAQVHTFEGFTLDKDFEERLGKGCKRNVAG